MAKYVNKESLTQTLSQHLNISKKQASYAVDLIFDEMAEALAQDGQVDISSFGKFDIFDRKERMGINPVSKERMVIPSSKLPKFRPSQTLKRKCNKDRSE